MKAKIFLFFIIVILSCDKKDVDFSKQMFEDTGLKIGKYIIIENNSNPSIGDYSENIYIQIDSLEFQNTIKQVNNLSLNENKWKRVPFGYRYEIYYPKDNVYEIYELNIKKRTVNYLYIEE